MNIAVLIASLRERGVALSLDGDRIALKGSSRVLTPKLTERLKSAREGVIAALRNEAASTASGRFPLTRAQEAVWATFVLDPLGVAYNLTGATELAPGIDLDRLDRALVLVASAHDALRARFGDENGIPYQVFGDVSDVKFERVPLPGWTDTDVRAWLDSQGRVPFDLRARRPWRAVLLIDATVEPHRIAMVGVLHHIIMDYWGSYVLQNELTEAYLSVLEGRPAELGHKTLRFRHVAAADSVALAESDSRLSYWRGVIPTHVPVLDLSAGRPRPRWQTFGGDYVTTEIGPDDARAIRSFAATAAITPFHLMLASFEVVLARQSGSQDFFIGVPTSGRADPRQHNLIADFANTVPVLCDVRAGVSGVELTRAVRDRLALAMENEVPFGSLIETLGIQRNPGITPVYQALLTWHWRPAWWVHGTDKLVIREIPVTRQQGALADLLAAVSEEGDNLLCVMSYNLDLFSRAQVQELLQRLVRLAVSIARNPDAGVLDLAVESGDLEACSMDVPALPLDGKETVLELIQRQGMLQPDKPAVRTESSEVSYRVLLEMSVRLAHLLRGSGVVAGDLVAVALTRDERMIAALLAIHRCGCGYVPLDLTHPAQRVEQILLEARPKVLLVDAGTRSLLGAGTSIPWVNLDAAHGSARTEPISDWPQPSLSNPAYVIATSGSTGRPKAALLTQRGLATLCAWARATFSAAEFESVLCSTSLCFDFSVVEIFATLSAGGCVVVIPDIMALGQTRLRDSVRMICTVPSAADALLREGQIPAGVRVLNLGGEALHAELVERIQQFLPEARIFNMYGPCEDTCATTATLVQRAERKPSIGRPLPGKRVYVLDESLRPVPKGGVGELFIGGRGLGVGYLSNDELTAAAFVADPFRSGPDARLYRTGDLVRIRESGELEFVGRVGRQVKLRGVRVELDEIEAVMMQHPDVGSAAVQLHLASTDVILVAYVTALQGAHLSTADVEQFLRRQLPSYMLPAAVLELSEFPRTATGKIDRRALPRPAVDARIEEPRGEYETELARMWLDVLGTHAVGRNDNFFLLGGHSLKASQIMTRVKKRFGVDFQITTLFECPTVRSLGERLSYLAAAQAELELTSLGSRDEPAPMSFAQERLWLSEEIQGRSAVYNSAVRVNVVGALDMRAFRAALTELVVDQPALRTRFHETREGVVQQPGRPDEVPFRFIELPPGPQSAAECEQLVDAEIHRPFDLRTQVPFRVLAVAGGERRHLLLFTFHHIAVDGWSLNLLGLLITRYYDWALGQGPRPMPPAIAYRDFAVWQRRWLEAGVLRSQLRHWRDVLVPTPPGVAPFADLVPARARSLEGHVVKFDLPEGLATQLQALARAQQTTLFAVLLAGFVGFLHRLTSATEFTVGTPVAARRRRELEEVVGFFVNMLVIRCQVGPEDGYIEVLRKVQTTLGHALRNQDVPFEKLVQELETERSGRKSPLFQTAFAYHERPVSVIPLGEATGTAELAWTRTSAYDFLMHIYDSGAQLSAVIVCAADLYSRSAIELLARAFVAFLESSVREPRCRMVELPCGEPPEELISGAPLQARATGGLAQMFTRAMSPESIAIEDLSGKAISYGALDELTSRFAGALRCCGIQPGDRVAIWGSPGPQAVIAILGILKAGAAYLPLDVHSPRLRCREILDSSGAVALIVLDPDAEAPSGSVANLDYSRMVAEEGATPIAAIPVAENEPACVLFTSGSTGRPKGVVLSHEGIARLVSDRDYAPFEPQIRFAFHANLGFDASTFEIWGALLNGGTLITLARDTLLSPPDLQTAIAARRVDAILVTTSLFHEIARVEPECFKPLHTLVVGGEVLDGRIARSVLDAAPPAHFINAYGPTECSTIATTFELTGSFPANAKVPIGKPINATQIVIRDAGGHAVPPGVPGELCIAGAGLALGYLNDEALTAKRFVDHRTASGRLVRLYTTGDVVSRAADGNLLFHGRLDSQVKIRGARVELAEVEAILARVAGVAAVAADLRPDRSGEPRLVAYVAAEDTASASSTALEQWRQEWTELYDQTYRNVAVHDPAPEFAGWNSSYTGTPIPAWEMREWVDRTVELIRALRPRRVLEIGVGTGLLMRALAAECVRYVGTDLSREAVQSAQGRVDEARMDVSLHVLEADRLEELPFETFDVVILNSVTQYFPTREYLDRVLAQAVARTVDDGHVFIGDVRSLALLEPFHLSVELTRCGEVMTASELRERVRRRVAHDKELVLHPGYFLDFAARTARASTPQIRPKTQRCDNELSRYRYDVTLSVGSSQAVREPEIVLDWSEQRLDPQRVAAILLGCGSDCIQITRIPHKRLQGDIAALHLLAQLPGDTRIEGGLRPDGGVMEGYEIHDLLDAVSQSGFDAQPAWSGGDAESVFDLVCVRTGSPGEASYKARLSASPRRLSNDPLQGLRARELEPRLRSEAAALMPGQMCPATYVFLDRLPLGAQGKLDRRALPPPPEFTRLAGIDTLPPSTPTEILIASIWAEVLDVHNISVSDDVFALGGHSLLATRVVSRLGALLGVRIPLALFFQHCTLGALARVVDEAGRQPRGARISIEVADRPERIPLSFAQQRLWFLDQLGMLGSAYNMAFAMRIRGPLDVELLGRSLGEVVRRQESLRTRIVTRDGEGVQVIDAFGEAPPLELCDLTGLGEQTEQRVREWLDVASRRPFHLDEESLFRASLLRLGREEHVFVFVIHHVICDGWSVGNLLRELGEFYDSYLNARVPSLPDLALHYADFSLWQRLSPQAAPSTEDLDFWRTTLHEAPALLELPWDRERPVEPSYRGETVPLQIDRHLSEKVRAFARTQGVTPYMVMLTTFYLLLFRWSRQSDIVVGTTLAARTHPQVEPLIGFFVNSLPLRADLGGDPTLRDLLMRVKDVALSVFSHQEVPFERIVDEVILERRADAHPLFQVMFTYENNLWPSDRLGPLHVSPVSIARQHSLFDMTLLLIEVGPEIQGHFEFASDLFDRESVETLAEIYSNLLRQTISTPGKRLSQLDLVTEVGVAVEEA